MEKQKLAQMVLAKMKEKKEKEERNRPHYEVLRLEALFKFEENERLKTQISNLEKELQKDKNRLTNLEEHLQELDNTGKKTYPRIIIKPEFIASENIKPQIKDFYRKSSNSFLKNDLLKIKGYETSLERENQILEQLRQIRALEQIIRRNTAQDLRITNEKRVKVLKEDLRLRSIREEQRVIKETIENERFNNRDLLKEYQIKKVNLESRKERLKYVQEQIEMYKNKIQAAYNPVAYRQFLKNVFDLRIKNQMMEKNLENVTKKVKQIQTTTQLYQRKLEKTNSLVLLGKVSDSPSKKRGSLQNRLMQEKQRKNKKSVEKRTYSADSKEKSRSSFSQLTKEKEIERTRTSLKTSDRNLIPMSKNELTRKLFGTQ